MLLKLMLRAKLGFKQDTLFFIYLFLALSPKDTLDCHMGEGSKKNPKVFSLPFSISDPLWQLPYHVPESTLKNPWRWSRSWSRSWKRTSTKSFSGKVQAHKRPKSSRLSSGRCCKISPELFNSCSITERMRTFGDVVSAKARDGFVVQRLKLLERWWYGHFNILMQQLCVLTIYMVAWI